MVSTSLSKSSLTFNSKRVGIKLSKSKLTAAIGLLLSILFKDEHEKNKSNLEDRLAELQNQMDAFRADTFQTLFDCKVCYIDFTLPYVDETGEFVGRSLMEAHDTLRQMELFSAPSELFPMIDEFSMIGIDG